MIITINEEKNHYIQNSYRSFKLEETFISSSDSVFPDVFHLEYSLIKDEITSQKEKAAVLSVNPTFEWYVLLRRGIS